MTSPLKYVLYDIRCHDDAAIAAELLPSPPQKDLAIFSLPYLEVDIMDKNRPTTPLWPL